MLTLNNAAQPSVSNVPLKSSPHSPFHSRLVGFTTLSTVPLLAPSRLMSETGSTSFTANHQYWSVPLSAT